MTIDRLKEAEATISALIDAEQPTVNAGGPDGAAAIARQDNLRPVLGAIRDAIFVFTDTACLRSLVSAAGLCYIDDTTEDDIDKAIQSLTTWMDGESVPATACLRVGRCLGAIEAAVDRGRGR